MYTNITVNCSRQVGGQAIGNLAVQSGLGGFHATPHNGGNPRKGVAPKEELHQEGARQFTNYQFLNLFPAC